MLDLALGVILGLLFPNMETRWLRQLLRVAFPVAVGVVRKLEDQAASNDQKFEFAAVEVALVLDTAFDALPEWRDTDEATKQRIIAGLVELALFIFRVSGGVNGGKAARQARRTIRRASQE